MTDSPHYTDHLIAALRCLDDDQLRKLAKEIKARIPQTCKACKGNGWFVFYGCREECQPCGGSGIILHNANVDASPPLTPQDHA